MQEIKFDQLGSWLTSWGSKSRDGDRVNFIVDSSSGKIPVGFVKRDNCEKLLVTYNGAVERSRSADGIVFQRSTWIAEFEASVLQFPDPTLLKDSGMSLGWGQLSQDQDAPPIWCEILNVFRKTFNLPAAEKTLHFGTSAGGFQAISTATLDRGSSVLVNNPQLDWYRYTSTVAVNRVLRNILKDPAGKKFLLSHPERVRVWELFNKEKYFPKMVLYTNTASPGDYYDQLQPFLRALPALGFLDTQWRLHTVFYRDSNAKHSPMPKGPTVKAIKEALDQLQ